MYEPEIEDGKPHPYLPRSLPHLPAPTCKPPPRREGRNCHTEKPRSEPYEMGEKPYTLTTHSVTRDNKCRRRNAPKGQRHVWGDIRLPWTLQKKRDTGRGNDTDEGAKFSRPLFPERNVPKG